MLRYTYIASLVTFCPKMRRTVVAANSFTTQRLSSSLYGSIRVTDTSVKGHGTWTAMHIGSWHYHFWLPGAPCNSSTVTQFFMCISGEENCFDLRKLLYFTDFHSRTRSPHIITCARHVPLHPMVHLQVRFFGLYSCFSRCHIFDQKVVAKSKVKFTLDQAMKAQTGSRCIAVLFL
jgi:hypothetical protein